MTDLESLPDRPLRLSELEAIQEADGVRSAVPRETCPCCGRVMTFEIVTEGWVALVLYRPGGWESEKRTL